MTRVQMHPIDGCITKKTGRFHRITDDQRYQFTIPTIQDIFMQCTGKGATVSFDGYAVVISLSRSFQSAATTGINPYNCELLAALLDNLPKGAYTSTQIRPYFNEPTALRKPSSCFFLTGSSLKPTIDLLPFHRHLCLFLERLPNVVGIVVLALTISRWL